MQETKGQKTIGMVSRNHVLLDNQSTMDQIANPNLLKNMRKSNTPITVHCNAGSMVTTLEGDLGNMTVRHNLHSIANVLSLKTVATRHHVTYDSTDRGGVFQVHTPNGVVEFKPSANMGCITLTCPKKTPTWSTCSCTHQEGDEMAIKKKKRNNAKRS